MSVFLIGNEIEIARPGIGLKYGLLISPVCKHGSVASGKCSVKCSVHELSVIVVSIKSFVASDRLSLCESSSVILYTILDEERGLDAKQHLNTDRNDGEHRLSVLMPLPSRSENEMSSLLKDVGW
jgi:hypothetical protein